MSTFELHVAAGGRLKLLSLFLVLDLIAPRLNKGALRTGSSAIGYGCRGAADVPLEVWEMVRSEVVELELQARGDATPATFRCRDCATRPYPRKGWFSWEDYASDWCLDCLSDSYVISSSSAMSRRSRRGR